MRKWGKIYVAEAKLPQLLWSTDLCTFSATRWSGVLNAKAIRARRRHSAATLELGDGPNGGGVFTSQPAERSRTLVVFDREQREVLWQVQKDPAPIVRDLNHPAWYWVTQAQRKIPNLFNTWWSEYQRLPQRLYEMRKLLHGVVVTGEAPAKLAAPTFVVLNGIADPQQQAVWWEWARSQPYACVVAPYWYARTDSTECQTVSRPYLGARMQGKLKRDLVMYTGEQYARAA